MRAGASGVRLAFSWLTVLPVHGPDTVDRRAAARAIAAAPLVGLVLGGVAAAIAWIGTAAGVSPALAGLVTVAALALCTRGMHVDGLADTFDGLGCYGPPERALEVMRSGGAGPFGVAALVVGIGAQALAFGTLAAAGQFAALIVAVTAGRVAVVWVCRRGTGAASEHGFGALTAGTQRIRVAVLWTVLLGTASVWVTTSWWQGPLAVTVAIGVSVALAAHCARRFGGLVGDTLGAVVELTVAVAAIGLSL